MPPTRKSGRLASLRTAKKDEVKNKSMVVSDGELTNAAIGENTITSETESDVDKENDKGKKIETIFLWV